MTPYILRLNGELTYAQIDELADEFVKAKVFGNANNAKSWIESSEIDIDQWVGGDFSGLFNKLDEIGIDYCFENHHQVTLRVHGETFTVERRKDDLILTAEQVRTLDCEWIVDQYENWTSEVTVTEEQKVYACDVNVYATVYVKAGSEEEARKIVLEDVAGSAMFLSHGDVPVSAKRFDDPNLPTVSLSPAVTVASEDNEVIVRDFQEITS